MIGLKDVIKDGAAELLKFLNETNINTWVLSGDDEESTKALASTLKIINSDNHDNKQN